MKRYSLVIICTAFLVCFLFASCGGEGAPEITEPVADPSGQKFNSWDQYLPLTLKTAGGEEVEVAVKTLFDTNCKESDSIKEQLMTDERLSASMILAESEGWNFDMMRLVKIRLFLMPWKDTDFVKDKVLFTVYTGMYINGNALGGACFGPIESPTSRTAPISSTDLEGWQSCGGAATKDESEFEPFVYVYSPMILTEPAGGKAYYETVIYALLPIAEHMEGKASYVIGVTDDDSSGDAFMSFTLEDVPTKGKLLWEIPMSNNLQ